MKQYKILIERKLVKTGKSTFIHCQFPYKKVSIYFVIITD